ncbi:MAG: hypothetical protein CK546_02500 [Pedosphaera sp.]|jgi:hypothetical protein|nr:MAG: hypothetical protein CK546_02500 [Pedosphaera sp.]
MNSEFKPLADAIYRERVLRARRTPPEERLLDGVRLYDQALERMRMGVQLQHPEAGAEEVECLLVSRVQKMWRLSDHGYYRPA